MEGNITMTHRVLSVDERTKTQPARRAFMEEYLHAGYEFVEPESFDDAALLEAAAGACALTTGFAPITREMMEAGPEIKVVGKVGTGVDNIDVVAATELGIPVANAPGWMRCIPVAEHAMALTLIMARRPWLWPVGERKLHVQLQGAVLGIVGLGNIGGALARRAAAFEMEICAYTRTRGKFKPQGFEVEEVETLHELLVRADFVALTLPLTPENQGMIGEKELDLMKETACLINVSRGSHVDTDALADAVREGKIAGAGLDVVEPDPLPGDHPLHGFPNVVMSPHNAAQTESVQRESYKLLCDNIKRAVEGEKVTSLANPEIYE